MSLGVNVSVEIAYEQLVQEIGYDGQEIYQQPLSMSENLTKLAQKIDFAEVESEDQLLLAEAALNEEAEDPCQKDLSSQTPPWPWESVRNKLKDTFTEVSVLADVLAIAKDKRYMVLDPVSQEPPEPKLITQMLAKKKALGLASTVLLNGAERLRISQFEINKTRGLPDFHFELLRLRQNWRLKKVGNSILGDLSYKTAGSRFWQSGVFEVTKNDEQQQQPPTTSPVSPGPAGSNLHKNVSALKVTVPSELEGISYIQVTIQKDMETMCSARLTIPNPQSALNTNDAHWQQKLEAAQNVLFCKELFSQLAREAVQLESPIPHMVVGNQITASLFPGIQLVIGLCHSANQDKLKGGAPPVQKPDHNHVLEHSLHQLLREVHHKNMHLPMPHPTTAMLGVSKRRRLAGPDAYDRKTLIEMTKSETLLEQLLKQAQHVVLRLRTMYVIDTVAREIKDPLLVAHWNCLNSPTQSCVKINIQTLGYDTLCRTSLVVHVGERNLKAICRDGRIMRMSYEPQELRDLILYMISHHQMSAVQMLAKLMGWQVLAANHQVGVGPVEPLGNASTVLMASPTGDRVISVRCSPQHGNQVMVQYLPRKDFYPSQLVKDMKWEKIGGTFKEVRIDKMEGKNFQNKMEFLMTSLTNF